jgi:hypothetical protein
MRNLAAATVLVLAIAGCDVAPVATVAPTVESITPAVEPVAATPAPTAIPATEGTGLRSILVEKIDVGTGIVHFADVAVYFDREADKAAREDGQPGGAPNPVWIRELGTSGSLALDPEARVTMLGHDAEGNRVPMAADVATFVRVFTIGAPTRDWDVGPVMFVGVQDGRIVSIEQVETP